MDPRPIFSAPSAWRKRASFRYATMVCASPSSGRIATLSTNTEGLMSGRYSTYSKLKINYPHQRVLRITFDRPETYNSVDAETHTELTHIWHDINEDPDIGAVIVAVPAK